MQYGDDFKQTHPFWLEMHRHLATIFLAGNTFYQPGLFTAIDEGNSAVVSGLQSFSQFTDGGPITSRESLYMQQQ